MLIHIIVLVMAVAVLLNSLCTRKLIERIDKLEELYDLQCRINDNFTQCMNETIDNFLSDLHIVNDKIDEDINIQCRINESLMQRIDHIVDEVEEVKSYVEAV